MMGVFVVLFKKAEYLMKIGSDNIMSKIMSSGMIMLIITFFFPNRYIRHFNKYVYSLLNKPLVNSSKNTLWFITFFIGILFSFAIINFEKFVNESIINKNLTKIMHTILHKL